MQFKYGTYEFEDNNVSASWTERPLMSDSGFQIGRVEMITLFGRLNGDGVTAELLQADLTTKITALRSALSVNGQTLTLYENAGDVSAINLVSPGSLGGVQVMNRSLPSLRDAQYATYVDFTVDMEVEYITSDIPYHSFSDSFQVTGNGGPRKVVLEGAFQTQGQTTRPQTAVRAVQSGSASRIGGIWPSFPPQLFPSLLQNPEESRMAFTTWDKGKPIRQISWNYIYISEVPLSAVPILR